MSTVQTSMPADLVSASQSLEDLARDAATCRGCDLYRAATQTVFGEGKPQARLMLVGEMPGNDEDLAGRPFVGPAGRVLEEALIDAGIPRRAVYVTNVVKHFKWEPKGRRRLHKTPSAREIRACRPWLDAEIARLHPFVLVCLGATAAKTLLTPDFRVSRDRGRFFESGLAPYVLATGHPSAILRIPDLVARELAHLALVDDLKTVKQVLQEHLSSNQPGASDGTPTRPWPADQG